MAKAKDPKKVKAGTKGGKMSRSRNREAIQADRMKQTFLMRVRGMTFEAIGEKLGLGHSRVIEIYQQAMKARVPEDTALAVELREKQLARLSLFEDRILDLALDRGLVVENPGEDGQVVQMPDFEALHKLNASLVKNYVQQARLGGAYKPTQVEEVNKGPGLNIAKLAALVADQVDEEKGQ